MRSNKVRLGVESLETREVPSAFVFRGSVDNWWANANNWTKDGAATATLPGSADDVTIDPATPGTACRYNPSAAVSIKTLTMVNGSTLDLSYAANTAHTLTVAGGGTSTLGVLGGGSKALVTLSPGTGSYTGTDLIFTGATHEVLLHNVWFNSTDPDGRTVYFKNKMTRADGTLWLRARSIIGSGVDSANFEAKTDGNIELDATGSITVQDEAKLFLLHGGIARDGANSRKLANYGRVVTDVVEGGTYTVQPPIGGYGKSLIMGGKLKATFITEEVPELVLYAGAGWDVDGELQTLGAGDALHLVTDTTGDQAGANMYGDFEFDGSEETFHAFTHAKPDLDFLSGTNWLTDDFDWYFGDFSATPTSFGVHLQEDAYDNCSWSGVGDTLVFQIYAATAVEHALLTTDGQFSTTGTYLVVSTGGTVPSNTNVALVTSATTLSLGFATVTYTGYTWNLWLPDAYTFGVTNVSPPPPPPPPPPPGGGGA